MIVFIWVLLFESCPSIRNGIRRAKVSPFLLIAIGMYVPTCRLSYRSLNKVRNGNLKRCGRQANLEVSILKHRSRGRQADSAKRANLTPLSAFRFALGSRDLAYRQVPTIAIADRVRVASVCLKLIQAMDSLHAARLQGASRALQNQFSWEGISNPGVVVCVCLSLVSRVWKRWNQGRVQMVSLGGM